jgi:ATP-dependent RNA helicase DeaD
MSNSFRSLGLHEDLLKALDERGFVTPTEIQAKTIPVLLGKKIDFHGQAQTGTGKTLAFGLPLLNNLDRSNKKTQVLIVAPTRELAQQIFEALTEAARFAHITMAAVYGGMSFGLQQQQLRRGAQVVIGTPGRINDHIDRKTLLLDAVSLVVLDEADIMLDMGFREDIELILSHTSAQRSIWLFSATVKEGIAQLMRTHMKDTRSISVSSSLPTASKTIQYYTPVSGSGRFEALCRLIEVTDQFYGFVFCQTKLTTADIAQQLARRGIKAHALHGDMSQPHRNKVIDQFKKHEFAVLVATDVAARGIDVPDISHVINYTSPDDEEAYVHRIGRTGRAGKAGIAITLVTEREMRRLAFLARKFACSIAPYPVPSVQELVARRAETVRSHVTALLGQVIAGSSPIAASLDTLASEYTQAELKALCSALLRDRFFSSFDESASNGPRITELPIITAQTRFGGSSGRSDGSGRSSVSERRFPRRSSNGGGGRSFDRPKRSSFSGGRSSSSFGGGASRPSRKPEGRSYTAA